MSTARVEAERGGPLQARPAVWVLTVIGIVVLGFFFPGLGLVFSVAVAMTVLRGSRRELICIAIGLVSLVVVLIGMWGMAPGGPHGGSSRTTSVGTS